MKTPAIDTYNFERLITRNHIYVDKTKHLYNLINENYGYLFFLSRPRRFGKSLMLSTIRAIFEGKRDLFKGTFIDTADYD